MYKQINENIFLWLIIGVNFFWDVFMSYYKYLPHILLFVMLIFYIIVYKKIKMDMQFVVIISCIMVHGLVNCFFGNTEASYMIIQVLTIIINYMAFSNILEMYSIKNIISAYWKSAYFMGIIAIVQEICGILGMSNNSSIPVLRWFIRYFENMSGHIVRVRGLCSEASFLGYYLAPAICIIMFLILKNKLISEEFKNEIKKRQMIVILVGFLFSFSAVAYIGLLIVFIIILFSENNSFKKFFMIAGTLIVCYVVYSNIPFIKIRVDDTFAMFRNYGNNYNSVNLSSYTLYLAYVVTRKSLRYTLLLGGGIGSCSNMYSKFALAGWGGQKLILNSDDANSLFLRLLIEFGVIGIVTLVAFLVRNLPKQKNDNFVISMSILTLLFMILLRQGNYTHAGLLMYVYLYVRIKKEERWQFIKNK